MVENIVRSKPFIHCGWEGGGEGVEKAAVTKLCGLHKVLVVLFFKGTPVPEIFNLGGQYFYFSLKQLVENRNRQAMKA